MKQKKFFFKIFFTPLNIWVFLKKKTKKLMKKKNNYQEPKHYVFACVFFSFFSGFAANLYIPIVLTNWDHGYIQSKFKTKHSFNLFMASISIYKSNYDYLSLFNNIVMFYFSNNMKEAKNGERLHVPHHVKILGFVQK